MKHRFQRILSLVMALALCLCLPVGLATPASAAETSGSCGTDLTWSFADGRLTISGSGDMTDFNQVNTAPWYAFREEILYLSLPEGLISIGNMAFYDCVNLTAVTIPSTVKDIGKLAFCQCYNISILRLNSGLESIGRSAFEQCKKLQDVRLPETLTTLGYHAFYGCYQLQYVIVPESVTKMDTGVFAYCENLLRADFRASVDKVPAWTFYGCGNMTSLVLADNITGVNATAFTGCNRLNVVYFQGEEEIAQLIRQQIANDSEGFQYFGTVTDAAPDEVASFDQVLEGENGETITTNTTVTQNQDATINTTGSTTVTEDGQSASVEVVATLFSEEGWALLMETILAAQEQLRNQANDGVTNDGIQVDVYLTEDSTIPSDVLNQVAGNNVNMTVQTQDGSKVTLNGNTMESNQNAESVQFTYTLQQMTEPDFGALSGVAAYRLHFDSSSTVRVEVMIRLPAQYARNTATLYQVSGNKLIILQSVVVDTMGYAHYYLANIDAQQSYRIGINDSGIDQDSILVPDELHGEYGITATYFDVTKQYVITGQTSSWGMSMNQVTWIMIGVMGGCVICVGVVVYILNKRKLKRGYVPDISQEDLS